MLLGAELSLMFDATATISSSFFETEEEEVDFVCQVKLKTGDYLFKRMKRLLQLLQLNSMEMVC